MIPTSFFFSDSWLTTLIAAAVILLIAVGYRLIKWYRESVLPKKRSAVNDHDRSMKALKKLLGAHIRRNDGRVIYSAEVGSKKTQSHADAILIGKFGVLVMMASDLSGEIYADEQSARISRVIRQTSTYYDNLFSAAKEAETAIRQMLQEKGLLRIPVESAVVFTRARAVPIVPDSFRWFKKKSLLSALGSRYAEDRGVDADKVAEVVLSWR